MMLGFCGSFPSMAMTSLATNSKDKATTPIEVEVLELAERWWIDFLFI